MSLRRKDTIGNFRLFFKAHLGRLPLKFRFLVSELTIEGNRLAPRVLIPCMPELLVGNDDSKSENVEIEFKIVPIFINIGINEKQSLTDAMAKENKKSIIGIGSKYYRVSSEI